MGAIETVRHMSLSYNVYRTVSLDGSCVVGCSDWALFGFPAMKANARSPAGTFRSPIRIKNTASVEVSNDAVRFFCGRKSVMGNGCLKPRRDLRIFAQGSNGAKPLPVLTDIESDSYTTTHAFSNFSNWLIPDQVMLGRYPFVEPSRCKTRDMAEEQLKMILETGIRTFVCLQNELPPQEGMRLAGEAGFLPYKATADLMAAALAGPPPTEIVEGLRNPTLDKFLPPRRRKEAPEYGHDVFFVHCPIVDLSIPSTEALEGLLDDLEQRILKGEKLYIHCWGGRGRAGTVGACLLAKLYNVTADEALRRVARAFQTRGDGTYRSPETDEQVQFVKNFVRKHR